MSPERMAEVVAWWVRLYTRNLPPPIADRRIDEIGADLHDHVAQERARGTTDRRIVTSIAARMVRGMAADASWRSRTMTRSGRKTGTMTRPATRSFIRVALVTALLLLVPLVAMQRTDGVAWGVFDFVFAAVLLGGTGLLLELAVRNRNAVVPRAAAVAIGVAAIVLGEMDDAPGLVGFGCLLVLGAVALTVRTALRSK